jgi:hypothetical protein
MTFHVYAVTDRPDQPLPDRPGLDDKLLAQVVWHDVGAVVSAREEVVRPAEADELWRHEEVIEALMIDRAVLPARFGPPLSPQRLGDMLARAYPQLVRDLERVRGHVEIGVSFLMTAEQDTPDDMAFRAGIAMPGPMPGTTYLLARLARERELRSRRQMRLEMVHEAFAVLTGLATAGRLDEPNDRHVLSAAFLVARERIHLFQRAAARAADADPQLALLCTGPWPPYSFVGNETSPGARQATRLQP